MIGRTRHLSAKAGTTPLTDCHRPRQSFFTIDLISGFLASFLGFLSFLSFFWLLFPLPMMNPSYLSVLNGPDRVTRNR